VAEAVTGGPLTLTWSGQAVDAGRIEAELVRLRYEAAGAPSGGEGFAIRTSLLNLVVHAADEESALDASQTIAGLAGHHPSRTLIVIPRPSEGRSRIDAQLAAHCHITAGLEQQVCCEEVTLSVQGPAAHHLHSVIIPLLVPDLPVYVGWLSARLGWQTAGAAAQGEGRLTLRHDGREVAVRLAPKPYEGLEAGWLLSIRLERPAGAGRASVSIARADDPLHLAIEIRDPDYRREDRVRIEPCDPGQMLAQELDDVPGHDPEYKPALERALPLIEALQAE
jgi:hypothetical protein